MKVDIVDFIVRVSTVFIYSHNSGDIVALVHINHPEYCLDVHFRDLLKKVDFYYKNCIAILIFYQIKHFQDHNRSIVLGMFLTWPCFLFFIFTDLRWQTKYFFLACSCFRISLLQFDKGETKYLI